MENGTSQEPLPLCSLALDLLALVALVTAVLLLDAPALSRQMLLALASLAFLIRTAGRSGLPSSQIGVAIAIALTGEIILSPLLHLYTYRDGFIPFFVPVGHGIFYAFAVRTDLAFRCERCRKRVVHLVQVAGSIAATVCLFASDDEWGLLWWAVVVILIARGRSPFLLSVCYLYTLALEIAGTSIGAWSWRPEIELLHLHSGNPPFGVGLLYCILDVATLSACRMLSRSSLTNAQVLADAALPQ